MASDQPSDRDQRPDSRLRLGLETTLLAWIRTGLAMMGFGFVLARFGLFLQALTGTSQADGRQVHASLWSGILLIVLGVAVNLITALMHYPYLVKTRTGEDDLPATWKLGLVLAVVTAVGGAGMTVLLFLMNWST